MASKKPSKTTKSKKIVKSKKPSKKVPPAKKIETDVSSPAVIEEKPDKKAVLSNILSIVSIATLEISNRINELSKLKVELLKNNVNKKVSDQAENAMMNIQNSLKEIETALDSAG